MVLVEAYGGIRKIRTVCNKYSNVIGDKLRAIRYNQAGSGQVKNDTPGGFALQKHGDYRSRVLRIVGGFEIASELRKDPRCG